MWNGLCTELCTLLHLLTKVLIFSLMNHQYDFIFIIARLGDNLNMLIIGLYITNRENFVLSSAVLFAVKSYKCDCCCRI